jgi:hypothetical protein
MGWLLFGAFQARVLLMGLGFCPAGAFPLFGRGFRLAGAFQLLSMGFRLAGGRTFFCFAKRK